MKKDYLANSNWLKKLAVLSVLCLACSLQSFSQNRIVTGTVTSAEDSMGIPGVSVVVKGTTVGTTTDIDGKYQISVPAQQKLLVFSFVGMTTQEIEINSDVINVVMAIDALQMEEVVVTALGIKREKKALGYAVQDVKADELTQAGDADLVSSLQGKVAGVQINQTGGGVGGNSRIEIRGASSLAGNDAPLWVVDGVPFDNGNSRDGEIWGGTSRAGGAFDLNPEDIESVSVLKGPSAAALYGERGGNGVILVTTKKGARNQGLGISYSGNFSISEAAYMLDLQDRYGQGTNGEYDKESTSSWGPEMNGQLLEAWNGKEIPYSAQKDRLKDFTRTGTSQKHNLAFTAGNDDGSYRVSIGKDIMNGIYEDHKVEKLTFDLRADYDINSWLNIDTKVSYFLTEGKERPEVGTYSYVSYFNTMPMNIRNQDLAPGYDLVSGKHVEKLYNNNPNANYRNPYFLQAQTTNSDEKNRTFGYVAANLKLSSDLKAKFKYGMDFYQASIMEGYLFGDNVDSSRPNYNPSQSTFKEENYEFLLSYNKEINEDFTIGLNFGANKMRQESEGLNAKSGRLSSEEDFFLGAGSNIFVEESYGESEVRSLYGFGQVAYKNMLFLDMTYRHDWSSTLTAADADYDNSYSYPSVSLSGILSEMVDMPQWVSFAKVRGSYAVVGKSASAYSTFQGYSLRNWNYNLTVGDVQKVGVIDNLNPEKPYSWEIGMDLRLFDNRLGLDFTYYNEDTKNQILKIETAQSTGFESKWINAGKITNKGIEVMLSTVPVKTPDFTLGLNFNFAKNEGTLEELYEDVPQHSFGEGVYAFPGEKLGQIKGTVYKRSEDGKIVVDDKGLMVVDQETQVLGNLQPDWIGAIDLNMEYKGLFFSALVSMREGGEIISSSEQGAVSAGTAARTTANDRMSFFFDGVTSDGGPNNALISAEEYWRKLAQVDEEFVYDASFMKLKEVALGYNLPKSLLNKIPNNPVKSARISLVGRNLFYFYKHTPGTAPDASALSSNYSSQAFDFAPVPATRTYGFSLNVGF